MERDERTSSRAATGIQAFSGSVPAVRVWSDPAATPDGEPFVGESVSLFREPDAGNLPVRFDERGEETALCQTGLRRWGESPANRHREATVTAPLLDSTRHYTHHPPMSAARRS